MKQAFADLGLEFKPEMFNVFQEENHIIWDKIEKGELSREDIPYVRWQIILKRLGLKPMVWQWIMCSEAIFIIVQCR